MINREATIRWKGYDPDDLSPKSRKRVWANCDKCGKGRWVYRFSYSDLCNACSNRIKQMPPKPKYVAEEDRFIRETGIDRIKTIEERGYDPIDLKSGSGLLVWCVCQECGKSRWLSNQQSVPLCHKCWSGHRYDLTKPKYVPEEDRFIPNTGIDRIKTIEIVGYDPIELDPISGRKIWCVCQGCGKGRWLSKSLYHNLCHKCANSTEEHRRKISELMKGKYTGKDHPNWKGGLSFGKYCEKFNFAFKEMIRALFGRRCFLCGVTEEENNKKLDVHHVNYDKDCLCNSQCEFVPLCRRCHAKTNFKRQYWEDLIMCYLYPDRITMVDL